MWVHLGMTDRCVPFTSCSVAVTLTFDLNLEKACPEHISNNKWPRNCKFSMWVHLGMTDRCVPFTSCSVAVTLTFDLNLEKACPEHISNNKWPGNCKFSMWVHLGMTDRCVPFTSCCDLDLDLWPYFYSLHLLSC